MHHVVFFSLTLLVCLFPLPFLLMEILRVGSLNINGGRDERKRALVNEIIEQKNLHVTFLQETHSDVANEVEWGMWWKGQYVLSHKTNVSAGVAILFSPDLRVNVLKTEEVVNGRLILVRVDIDGFLFNFVNVYAPNVGHDRNIFFIILSDLLKQCSNDGNIIMGGDWNCTENFTVDRNSEEPHFQSSSQLSKIIRETEFLDMWRIKNPQVRQYTWVKVVDDRVSAARLDRIYVSNDFSCRIVDCFIIPVGFTDHHLVSLNIIMSKCEKKSSYWHFNTRLLQDVLFCEHFETFWQQWKMCKGSFESLKQWWEVGKINIKLFCQQHTANSTNKIRETIQSIEKDISSIEVELINRYEPDLLKNLQQKKRELGSLLHERVKGALVRSRFTSVTDMDAPSAFFFNLERKTAQQKQIACLRLPDGRVTSNVMEMRHHAVTFYSSLYTAEQCDTDCAEQLFHDLPQIDSESKVALDTELSFQELTVAVGQLGTGRSPGIDGLPSEFYKRFWNCIGQDLYEVLCECRKDGYLSVSCKRAVLSLLPKKGDLSLLKNWRPVALLTTEYKIISKCLANRLKEFLNLIIHKDQTYCIPKRTIMDNLFLIRDILDICKDFKMNVGLIALDQEKAFDRVDHNYLFNALKAFGFGKSFINWVKLLYTDAVCIVKVGGGLSCPIPVSRGIRQGCPLSGQLYSIAIEPLLFNLRKVLSGFTIPLYSQGSGIIVSAYADDVTVFVNHAKDIKALSNQLDVYEKASSAKVNWDKSEAFWAGQHFSEGFPQLPGNLSWKTEGLKILGIYLGSSEYQKLNWEGVEERVCTRLSRWNWLLPQLSYRGRVLVANNLVASTLWHKLGVLQPPAGLIQSIQRRLVTFFWSGQHWIRSSALYLSVQEGGQGLVDIKSRIMTFRLQAAQRLLYDNNSAWMDTAKALLRKAGGMGFDKHLFLMQLQEAAMVDLTPFYRSVLEAWKVFSISRPSDLPVGFWLLEEPLFFNSFLPSRLLTSENVRTRLLAAGCNKLGHFLKSDVEDLSQRSGVKSIRFIQKCITEISIGLRVDYRTFLENPAVLNQWTEGHDYIFPSITVSAAVQGWEEDESCLLSFRTPVLENFETVGKKSLYLICVKVSNIQLMNEVRSTRWTEFFGPDSSPKGCWRSLYKRPIDKRTGDLQWRIVHGAVATNRHVVHLNPSVGMGCLFCSEIESVFHLFVQCLRLGELFDVLRNWFFSLGEEFSFQMFIFGPKYSVQKKNVLVLINFLSGTAKLAIWKTRKNKLLGHESVSVLPMFLGLLASRLRIEYAYYKSVGCLPMFMEIWGINDVLCTLYEEELILGF